MAHWDSKSFTGRLPGLLSAAADLALGRPGLRAASYLAGRWMDASGTAPKTSVGLAVGVAVDEAFRTLMAALAHAPDSKDLAGLVAEAAQAAALFEERGWLANPTSYHLEPPPLTSPMVSSARHWGRDFQHLRFVSDYEPHLGEPGRERWLGYRPCREAHAWLLRHTDRPRPWLICVHGYRMGFPAADFHAFRIDWLHRELGLNVVMPILPLHGPRKSGRRTGDGFFSAALLDTVHAEAQAIWDLRRVLGWVRAQGGETVGAYGISLGGYTTALLAGVAPELTCALAAMPTTCFAALLQAHSPQSLLSSIERLGLRWEVVQRALHVVSPLALRPRVPRHGRRLIAAAGDRLLPAGQVEALWHHWEEPEIQWFDGTHLSFSWQGHLINRLVASALRGAGLLPDLDGGVGHERTAA